MFFDGFMIALWTVDSPRPRMTHIHTTSHQLLTPEATVHVEGEVLDIDEPPAKKLKKKVAELKGNAHLNFSK